MYKIGVLGDAQSVLGFKAIGLNTFSVDNEEQALNAFKDMTADRYGIIYVTESVYEMIENKIDAYQNLPYPAIIPIPGVTANTGRGMESVRKSVIKAVGSDIIFGNE